MDIMDIPNISDKMYKTDQMVITTIRCVSGKYDKSYHSETYQINPGETCLISLMLTKLYNEGVRYATVETVWAGQLGGITRSGQIWAINPN